MAPTLRGPISIDSPRDALDERERECRRIHKLVEQELGGELSLNSKTLINDAITLYQSGN